MVVAQATVEFRADTPCASWAVGGGNGDVKKGLYCDASEQQLWLIFFVFMTAYCVRSRFFGILFKWLVSAFAEITFFVWWTLLYWRLKLEIAWNRHANFIVVCLIQLAILGTCGKSYFLGRETIFETCNPAFGGRGPGFHRRLKGSKSSPQFSFDPACGFPCCPFSG